MEHISSELNFSLTLFFVVTAAIIGIAGVFMIRIFLELSKLIVSVDKFMELINYEFVPTIKEVQKTLTHISSISDKADKHISQLSDGIDSATVGTSSAMQKSKVYFASFLAGLAEAIKKLLGQI